jgi:hypothetical protein
LLSALSLGARVLIAVLGIPIWLVVGGVLSLGPQIGHGIEVKVGMFALGAAQFTWLALFFTGLIALANPTRLVMGMFKLNIFLWIVSLTYLYAQMLMR